MNFEEALKYLGHLPELAIDFNKIIKSSQNCEKVFHKGMKPSEINTKVTAGLVAVEKNIGLTGETAHILSNLVKDILLDVTKVETETTSLTKGLAVVEMLPKLFQDIIDLEAAAQKEIKSLKAGEEHDTLVKFTSVDTAIPAVTELLTSTISNVCTDSPVQPDHGGEL